MPESRKRFVEYEEAEPHHYVGEKVVILRKRDAERIRNYLRRRKRLDMMLHAEREEFIALLTREIKRYE